MKLLRPVSILLFFSLVSSPLLTAKLLFTDTFDRADGSETEDAIGNGWTTNSAWRADGDKQTFLEDGHLTITRLEKANHAVSVKHDFFLSDCSISLRFQLDENDQLAVNFNDPELKTSHAGHVCGIRVSTTKLSVADQMNGSMNLILRERRLAGDKSDDLKQAIAKTEKQVPINLKPNRWHELLFELHGDSVRIYINGVFQLEKQSPGFAHPTKRNIALSVPGNVTIDEFQVWDQARKK